MWRLRGERGESNTIDCHVGIDARSSSKNITREDSFQRTLYFSLNLSDMQKFELFELSNAGRPEEVRKYSVLRNEEISGLDEHYVLRV